jgi:Xaa-Pro dipeptidase
MDYRDDVYFNSQPENEAPFSAEEFAGRLDRLRQRMSESNIDMLYLMAPESMYYLSGYQAEWYQAQSPCTSITITTFFSTASARRC